MSLRKSDALLAAALSAPVLLFVLAVTAGAQVSTSVSGTVYDSSQAVVPAAAVTLTNTARNAVDVRNTNEVGRFLFSNLVPGPYQLDVSAPGFAAKTITGIMLTADCKLDLNIVLGVGVTEQKVVVTAGGTGLETATPTVGQVVDNRQIANLPLNGRQSLALSALVPNVRMGAGFDPTDFNGAAVFSINGGEPPAPKSSWTARPPWADSPGGMDRLTNRASMRCRSSGS